MIGTQKYLNMLFTHQLWCVISEIFGPEHFTRAVGHLMAFTKTFCGKKSMKTNEFIFSTLRDISHPKSKRNIL